MKPHTLTLFGLGCAAGLLLISTSCSSDAPEGSSSTTKAYTLGVPGGVTVQTFNTNATVKAIDPATRKLTLAGPEGEPFSYTVAPAVINFDQIQIGDHVKVTATTETAVSVRKKGEPSADGEAALITLAPKGAKPGGVLAHTVEVTARVTHIDHHYQRATLQFPDGTSRTIDVRGDVNLFEQSVGTEVVIRTTEAVAIRVEQP